MIIYGRSDATLNAGGIRIGTADIYRVVDETIKEVRDSVVVGLQVGKIGGDESSSVRHDGGRVQIDPKLRRTIQERIRDGCVKACP